MQEKCKKRVYGDTYRDRSCSRNAVKDGYCLQHHPDSVSKRREKSDALYEENRKNSYPYLMEQSGKRIVLLQKGIQKMKAAMLAGRPADPRDCEKWDEALDWADKNEGVK